MCDYYTCARRGQFPTCSFSCSVYHTYSNFVLRFSPYERYKSEMKDNAKNTMADKEKVDAILKKKVILLAPNILTRMMFKRWQTNLAMRRWKSWRGSLDSGNAPLEEGVKPLTANYSPIASLSSAKRRWPMVNRLAAWKALLESLPR